MSPWSNPYARARRGGKSGKFSRCGAGHYPNAIGKSSSAERTIVQPHHFPKNDEVKMTSRQTVRDLTASSHAHLDP
jgi:hypothetical protein